MEFDEYEKYALDGNGKLVTSTEPAGCGVVRLKHSAIACELVDILRQMCDHGVTWKVFKKGEKVSQVGFILKGTVSKPDYGCRFNDIHGCSENGSWPFLQEYNFFTDILLNLPGV